MTGSDTVSAADTETGSDTESTPDTEGGGSLTPLRVLLVDDQELVRAGFRLVIESQPDLSVVGEVGDGLAAVEAVQQLGPDLVLMDVRMPVLGGIEATRQIMELPAPPKVIVLTTYDLDENALAAIRAGAAGFLLKSTPPRDLLTALRTVHAGDAVIAPSTTRRLLEHHLAPARDPAAMVAIERLTEREREVLVAMARGCSNEEIGQRLAIAEGTVRTHVRRILAKLKVRDRVQAVVLAYDAGLPQPGR